MVLTFAKSLVHNFDQVCKYTEDGLQMSRDIAIFLKKRQQIESEASKSLVKLCMQMKELVPAEKRVPVIGSASGEDLFGSLQATWYNVIEETHQEALIQEFFASELIRVVVEPLQQRIKDLESQRKALVLEGQRESKELQESYTSLKKVKSLYDNQRRETEEVVSAFEKAKSNHTTKEKELAKIKGKMDSAYEKLNTANRHYQTKETECKKQQEEFFQVKMPDILTLFQTMEEERCRGSKQVFMSMKELFEDRFQRMATISEHFAGLVSSIDIHVDLDEFISQNAGEERSISVMSLLYPSKKGRLYMQKKSQDDRWRQFFFVLMADQQTLYYFDSEDSTKPRGTIHVPSGDRVVRPVDDSFFSKRNCFQIINYDDIFYFHSEEDVDRREWLDKLMNISCGLQFARRDTIVRHASSMHVRVIEAKKLAKTADYYCIVRLDNESQARTQTKRDTQAPFWSEEFLFDELPQQIDNVEFVIYNSKRDLGITFGSQKDVEIGKAIVPLRSLLADSVFEDWINIVYSPIVPGASAPSGVQVGDTVGSIRVRVKFLDEVIRPLQSYQPLLDLLDLSGPFLTVLGDAVSPADRESVARTLINVYHGKGSSIEFLIRLIKDEIQGTEDPNIIFRGNSLATKAVDQLMKMVAMKFLHNCLGSTVRQIYDAKSALEVDPTRVTNPNELKQNWRKLLTLMNHTWDAIQYSVDQCPNSMKLVFKAIVQTVWSKFGHDSISQYTAVGGFFFLRFLCPAILNPKLFDMMPTHPEEHTARTLTLIAKTLQNLANLVEFGAKEPYMNDMNEFIEANKEKMKQLITSLAMANVMDKEVNLGSVDLARHVAALHRYLETNKDSILSSSAIQSDTYLHSRLAEILDELSLPVETNSTQFYVDAIALYNYAGVRDDELSFSEGDSLRLLSLDAEDNLGWCVAEHNGNIGLVPLTYVWIEDTGVFNENENASSSLSSDLLREAQRQVSSGDMYESLERDAVSAGYAVPTLTKKSAMNSLVEEDPIYAAIPGATTADDSADVSVVPDLPDATVVPDMTKVVEEPESTFEDSKAQVVKAENQNAVYQSSPQQRERLNSVFGKTAAFPPPERKTSVSAGSNKTLTSFKAPNGQVYAKPALKPKPKISTIANSNLGGAPVSPPANKGSTSDVKISPNSKSNSSSSNNNGSSSGISSGNNSNRNSYSSSNSISNSNQNVVGKPQPIPRSSVILSKNPTKEDSNAQTTANKPLPNPRARSNSSGSSDSASKEWQAVNKSTENLMIEAISEDSVSQSSTVSKKPQIASRGGSASLTRAASVAGITSSMISQPLFVKGKSAEKSGGTSRLSAHGVPICAPNKAPPPQPSTPPSLAPNSNTSVSSVSSNSSNNNDSEEKPAWFKDFQKKAGAI